MSNEEKKQAKDVTFRIRLTPETRQLFDAEAKRQGYQGTSTWARAQLLALAAKSK